VDDAVVDDTAADSAAENARKTAEPPAWAGCKRSTNHQVSRPETTTSSNEDVAAAA
jgi:hypothetical protein